jgi:hypothetical protein
MPWAARLLYMAMLSTTDTLATARTDNVTVVGELATETIAPVDVSIASTVTSDESKATKDDRKAASKTLNMLAREM